MFSTSPGSFPEQNPITLSVNAEIEETLLDLGFIDSVQKLTPEDYTAIRTRKNIIEKGRRLTSETAISLACLDRMVNVQSGNEEATNRILATVNFTLIAPLIDDELLAENKEFLGTVEKTAVALFKQGGYLTFSDALFTAITQRQVAIAQTPVLTGMIDGQDNVIPKE